MEVSLHDIAYFLKVATGALSFDESTLYYVVEEDGNLIEKHWTGTELRDRVFISSGARSSPSAKYLLNGNTRRVFFPSADNTLQCAEYDDSEEEWTEVTLESEDSLIVHPDSLLSGCFDEHGQQLIFFQGPSGQLQGIRVQQTGECTAVPHFPVILESALVHTAFRTDSGAVHLLYIKDNNQIHDLKLDPTGSQWEGPIIPGYGFSDHEITNFTVTSTDEADQGLLGVSSEDKVIYVNPQGETSEVGQLDRERFAAVSSEECAGEIVRLATKAIKATAGTKR
ncbi:hypothetical protein N8T08_000400 [Aspergillus melleus]|uniref:Uncharacterized protein n=1 Tax=Aspergillus melleus TaxID=138277 RepID=A0ACC3BBM2_9EURO|nr:hypothetical protein N8T08_000400 [Aspergillus melleus]